MTPRDLKIINKDHLDDIEYLLKYNQKLIRLFLMGHPFDPDCTCVTHLINSRYKLMIESKNF